MSFTALQGIPEIRAGDDLAALLAAAMPVDAVSGEVLVVALNVVAKAEGRKVEDLFR